MPSICAVADCSSSFRNKSATLIFHCFPIKDSELCAKWIALCKRRDKFNPKTSAVCSAHFEAEAYSRDLRNELLGIPTRKILKPTAVPSIFPNRNNNSKKNPAVVEGRKVRAKVRAETKERKEIVRQLLGRFTPPKSIMPRNSSSTSSGGGASSSRKRSRYNLDDDDDYYGEPPPEMEVLIAHDPMLGPESSDEDTPGASNDYAGSTSSSSRRRRRDSQSSSSTQRSGGGGGGGSKKRKKKDKEEKKKKQEEVVNLEEDDGVDNEEVFYVEKIKDKRWNLGRWEYLLAWQGYGPEYDTWEPTENMDCDDLLQEFEAEWAKKKKYKFDEGEVAQELVGLVVNPEGKPRFMVHYKGCEEMEFVPPKVCNKYCPELVIEFYEHRQIGLPDRLFTDEELGFGGGGGGGEANKVGSGQATAAAATASSSAAAADDDTGPPVLDRQV